MQNLQTFEQNRSKLRNLVAPALAVTLGGAMLVGGKSEAAAEVVDTRPTQGAAAAVMRASVETTVTGKIDTLHGESIVARGDPYGGEVTGRYPDGASVEILCQAPGATVTGKPEDYGKPPLAGGTWYNISPSGEPKPGQEDCPEQWIPMMPVFTKDPVPSCQPR